MKSLRERFWEKVDVQSNDKCWNWKSHIGIGGYGEFWFNGGVKKAHRISWFLICGNLPENLCVLHKCDNPSCVNPNHLFLGSFGDNNKDKASKGRSTRGEKHYSNKLSEQQVKEIVMMRKSTNLSLEKIGKIFGVSDTLVYNIEKGYRWAWLER